MRLENHDLHGEGNAEHEVYDMPRRRPPVVVEEERWEKIPGEREEYLPCGCMHDCADADCRAGDPVDCGCDCAPCLSFRRADAQRALRGPRRVRVERPDGAEAWWEAVTDVPCPVKGCGQTVVWYEAGYVPGYRVCMARIEGSTFDHGTLRHRFFSGGCLDKGSTLIRDECCEKKPSKAARQRRR